MDAEAQFHAARTMLGHFHYIIRGASLFSLTSNSLAEFGIGETEKQYLKFARKQIEKQSTVKFTLLDQANMQ